MNTRPALRLFLPLAGLLLASSLHAQEVIEKPIIFWETSRATVSPDEFLPLQDAAQHIDLFPGPGTTARILADKDAPGGRALVFDGKQTAPLKPKDRVQHDGNLALTLWIRPEKGTDSQSVIYLYRNVELRYMQNRSVIKLLVWPAGDSPTVELDAPIKPGVWNALHATVRGHELELLVNGKAYGALIPADRPAGAPFNGAVTVGHGNNRPFSGGLAEILISSVKKPE